MENIKEINKARESIKKGPADNLLLQKPFARGMYRFSMFMINYYCRVRVKLKIDYDSFMIVQTVVTHKLYHLKKKDSSNSYKELEIEWEKLVKKYDQVLEIVTVSDTNIKSVNKLSISSICLVTGLPKETVRRKVNDLTKKNLLKISKKEGVILGSMYKKIFENFVPQTTLDLSKLLNNWEKNGILKNILSFKI